MGTGRFSFYSPAGFLMTYKGRAWKLEWEWQHRSQRLARRCAYPRFSGVLGAQGSVDGYRPNCNLSIFCKRNHIGFVGIRAARRPWNAALAPEQVRMPQRTTPAAEAFPVHIAQQVLLMTGRDCLRWGAGVRCTASE